MGNLQLVTGQDAHRKADTGQPSAIALNQVVPLSDDEPTR